MSELSHLTPKIARELLYYDPFSGRLIWRSRSVDWFENLRSCKTWNGRYAGKFAGCVTYNKSGYSLLQVKLLGRTFAARKVAWMIYTGEAPPEQLGHKNQDATDIRWSNLTTSSPSDNAKNRHISPLNTSGRTGVYWHTRKKKWVSQIKVEGKLIRLGIFSDFEDAVKARAIAEKEYGFSPNHGSKRNSNGTASK